MVTTAWLGVLVLVSGVVARMITPPDPGLFLFAWTMILAVGIPSYFVGRAQGKRRVQPTGHGELRNTASSE